MAEPARVHVEEHRGFLVERPVIKVTGAGFVREDDAARYLGVSGRQMRRMRAEDRGPSHSDFCGRSWYSLAALDEYLAACHHETKR